MLNWHPAYLKLANGHIFGGLTPNPAVCNSHGEVVFNTGMTGYEETLTDPSYAGQIINFTYPILGNYGVSSNASWESNTIHAKGVICASVFDNPSHYARQQSFIAWLNQQQIPLICAIDTRELTKVIREDGLVNGVISLDKSSIVKLEYDNSLNLVSIVSCKKPYTLGSGKYKIIVVDCGIKQNILRSLLRFDLILKCVPFDYDYTKEDYDGILVSNGPGDPKLCSVTIKHLKEALAQTKPIFGICLGSQLMALAIGATTHKLKYGHRGHNQPCVDLKSQRCYLTAQNHSYAVEEQSLPKEWVVNFRNLNDHTVAGIAHKTLPFFAVQFHPEASGGPQDSFFLFEQFYQLIVAGAKLCKTF